MPRKQDKNMNGGGWFTNLLGIKSAEEISPDERAKHLKELESKSAKDLASMVVRLEDKVKELEGKISALENPVAPTAAAAAPAAPAAAAEPVSGGRRQRRKTRKSNK